MLDLVYIYQGSDSFLVENAVDSLINSLDVDPFNILTYDLEEHSLDELLQEITTISFFADKKIVKVKNPWFFYESSTEEGINDLMRYFKNPNEDTTLIFMVSKSLDNSLKISKEAKKYIRIEVIKDMDKGDFTPYVEKTFSQYGYVINQDAIAELVERTNYDFNLLNNEISKLKLYTVDIKKVTINDVKLLTSRNLEENIYEITNALIAKNKKKILEVYSDLLEKNEDPIRIVSQISSKLKETINTKMLIQSGYTQDMIATYFNIKPGRAYYMVKNASTQRIKDLENYFEKLSTLDFKIKSGEIDKKLGLELFLLEV